MVQILRYLHTTLFGFYVIDEDNKMLWLSMSRYYDNESENTRTKSILFEFFCFQPLIKQILIRFMIYKNVFYQNLNQHLPRWIDCFFRIMKNQSPSDKNIHKQLFRLALMKSWRKICNFHMWPNRDILILMTRSCFLWTLIVVLIEYFIRI